MTGLARRCPLCGADETKPHWQKDPLRLVQCTGCGMVYANPIPPELVSGIHYAQQATAYHLSKAKLESDYAPSRFVREARLLREFCQGGAVLDVGCSTGGFLHQLKETGRYEVTGLDVAGPATAHAASRGIEVISGSFLDHDFGERRFDAVTLWAVIEHLAEPSRAVQKATGLLKPGGHLLALVPNLKSLATRLLGARYRYVMPEHVNYFEKATLRCLIEHEPALAPVRLASMHFNPVVIWQDWRSKGRLVPTEERARLLQQTTALKQSTWLQPVRWLYSGVELALGRLQLADNLVIVARKQSRPAKT